MREDLTKVLMIFFISLGFRFLFAPFSSGSDIPQFAGFADTFRTSGLCFYVESSSPLGENWPYPWLFPYGPLFLLMLLPLRILAPSSVVTYVNKGTYYVKVPLDWVLAIKTLFVFLDSLIATIIYAISKGRVEERYALILALAYAFSPIAVYNSAIYGMFDHIALTFLLLSLVYYDRPGLSGALGGISILIKPTTLFPYIGIFLSYVKEDLKRAFKWAIYFLLAIVLVFYPFIVVCPQTIAAIERIIEWRGGAYYKLPIVYTVNGMTALATYLHVYHGIDTLIIIRSLWLLLGLYSIIATIATLYIRDIYLIALLWYVTFLAGFWGDNPQFLVPLVGLGLLVMGHKRRSIRISSALMVLWASLWPITYPIDFWFHVHVMMTNEFVRRVARELSLLSLSDLGYTIYFVSLYLLEVSFMITTLISSRMRYFQKEEMRRTSEPRP